MRSPPFSHKPSGLGQGPTLQNPKRFRCRLPRYLILNVKSLVALSIDAIIQQLQRAITNGFIDGLEGISGKPMPTVSALKTKKEYYEDLDLWEEPRTVIHQAVNWDSTPWT